MKQIILFFTVHLPLVHLKPKPADKPIITKTESHIYQDCGNGAALKDREDCVRASPFPTLFCAGGSVRRG